MADALAKDPCRNIPQSFCCPPNVVRTLSEVQHYFYALSKDALFINLYGANTLKTGWKDGDTIQLTQETRYPWDGSIRIVIQTAPEHAKQLKLRIPEWVNPALTHMKLNGELLPETPQPGSYFTLARKWVVGDVIELEMGFELAVYEANPLIEEDTNQVAVKYGPLVYCAEALDLPEGVSIGDLRISPDFDRDQVRLHSEKVAGSEIQFIELPALAAKTDDWQAQTLYRKRQEPALQPITLKLIPYYAWDNRGECDMSIWFPLASGK